MKRTFFAALGCVALMVMTAAQSQAGVMATSVIGFPTENSTTRDAISGFGTLGSGGGGQHYNIGDYVEETFGNTGLANTDSSRWQFSMSDVTELGTVNTFDARINGVTVGSYSFIGDGNPGSTRSFDLNFAYAPISSYTSVLGPDSFFFTLIATSAVPIGDGSWNWFPGGTVTLSGMQSANAVPEPASLAIFAFGACAFGVTTYRRRRKMTV
ncbi:PEP-CTERM motif protein [Rubripirellula tenax]|uniref:PEP-CTERM motif protein n=1 Tax=Rubripirellula tenax TaxID=2528015 RepID=A0A5C6FF48_9BACT|nr:PEP-CTERM sorting domain-containing protein [Rubripirellula tenax]TWU60131.1 PEP-CTERM motif protein [Rubripirellula tenax]